MTHHRDELETEAIRLGIQDIDRMDEQELQDAVDKANDIKQGQPPQHPPGASSA